MVACFSGFGFYFFLFGLVFGCFVCVCVVFYYFYIYIYKKDGLNAEVICKSCFSHSGITAIPVGFLMKRGQDQTFCPDCAVLSQRIEKCVCR